MENAGLTNLLLGIILTLLSALGWFVVAKFSSIGKEFASIKNTINAIKHNTTRIIFALIGEGILDEKQQVMLRDMSPTTLTEKGLETLEKSGFKDIFEAQKDKFFGKIDELQPKTKYDVEQYSLGTVLDLFDEEYFKPVKNYLFDNSRLDDNLWMKTAGVYVRDKYLEKHTEIV